MATTDNRPPARLLHGVSRTRDHVVWGFPFDYRAIVNNYKRIAPNDKDPTNLAEYSCKISIELCHKCNLIWCSPGMVSTPTPVRPRGKTRALVALIRATRPDDRFLPPPEIIEKMKAIFAEAGYTKEPGWYIEDD